MSEHFTTKAVGLYTVLLFKRNFRKLHNEEVECVSALYVMSYYVPNGVEGKV